MSVVRRGACDQLRLSAVDAFESVSSQVYERLAAITAVSADDIWMVSHDDFLHYTCR